MSLQRGTFAKWLTQVLLGELTERDWTLGARASVKGNHKGVFFQKWREPGDPEEGGGGKLEGTRRDVPALT